MSEVIKYTSCGFESVPYLSTILFTKLIIMDMNIKAKNKNFHPALCHGGEMSPNSLTQTHEMMACTLGTVM